MISYSSVSPIPILLWILNVFPRFGPWISYFPLHIFFYMKALHFPLSTFMPFQTSSTDFKPFLSEWRFNFPVLPGFLTGYRIYSLSLETFQHFDFSFSFTLSSICFHIYNELYFKSFVQWPSAISHTNCSVLKFQPFFFPCDQFFSIYTLTAISRMFFFYYYLKATDYWTGLLNMHQILLRA